MEVEGEDKDKGAECEDGVTKAVREMDKELSLDGTEMEDEDD